MKTRAQIYSHEASGILRDISTYGVLTQKQILGLYPQKDEQIKNLLSYRVYLPLSAIPSEVKTAHLPQPCALAVEKIKPVSFDCVESAD